MFPACLLQKQTVDYARVREYSLRVLTWRPDDVKALYRAGVAILEMGDAQTAKHYLTKACNEQPHGMNLTMFCSFLTDVSYLHVSEPSSVLNLLLCLQWQYLQLANLWSVCKYPHCRTNNGLCYLLIIK